MEPWQSWAALLLGGGAAWYYYNNTRSGPRKAGRSASISQKAERSQARSHDGHRTKRGKDRDGVTASPDLSGNDSREGLSSAPNSDRDKGRKPRSEKNGPKSALGSAVETVESTKSMETAKSPPSDDGDVAKETLDNKEFARQLSVLKTGTILPAPLKTGGRVKTTKQARANADAARLSVAESSGTSFGSQNASTPSSTTGADADDDLSPALSPAFGASSAGQSVTAEIADMLEAPAPGPAILRLTEPTQSSRPSKPVPKKTAPVEETKKQRQNRRKAEERKLAREEDEKQRRVLLEKQLRTAREAEGRPAKNGLLSAKVPASSAWSSTQGPPNGNHVRAALSSTASNAPLLDTFVPEAVPAPRPNGTANGATNGLKPAEAPTGRIWDRDLPSEEEQMRMIQEMNDGGWSTVPKGKKSKSKSKRAPVTPAGTNGHSTANESSENERVDEGARTPSTGEPISGVGNAHVSDSDWAVV
ncbi:MAG: hypothetical protein M1838_002897 [Thelocarpon superellum]|nr:MAG: hypothetical protein M1838_002897 [Thelocarpon superellum]